MTKHVHRPSKDSKTYCWTACVDPNRPHSEASHGNVVEVQYCRCGAYRLVEVNYTHRHAGPWQTPQNK
jgi:hypothetical protein